MDQTATNSSLPLRPVLSFSSPEYEQRFVAHYVSFYLRTAQASIVLGILLMVGDFLVDHIAYPEVKSNLLRLLVCVPLLCLTLVYSLMPDARRRWQIVIPGFVVVVGCCLFWILLRIDMEGGAGLKAWAGIANFILMELYCFVMLGVQFRYALTAGIALLLAFVVAMLAHAGFSADEIPYWAYHAGTVVFLTAGIGWWREYLLRKEFVARTALDDARAAAERLARTKSDFLATMSHEIRTPMNGVLGMAELLLQSGLTEAQQRHVHTIRASGDALLTILNDILDFSKLEAGRVALDPIEIDIRDLGEDAVQLLALPAQMKGLALTCRVAGDVPAVVVADPVRIRQILLNLLGNAVKFTPSGEIELAIERVESTSSDRGGAPCMLRFTVTDTGIGITQEARSRLFQPFSQADGSTTRRYGGTGLGLAVCKQLAEVMGGTIGLESEPDLGSRFWFTTRVSIPDEVRADNGIDLHGVRVLLVESHAAQRKVLTEMLRAMGASCVDVDDGATALEAMRRALVDDEPFALVVAAARMAAMSGSELIYAVRSDRRLHGTPVVMLTALSETMDTKAGAATGADAVLGMPVRRRELGEAVARLAGRRSAATPAIESRSVETIDLTGLRVLVAEDNPVNQMITRSLLESVGCSVTVAVDGAAALACWREQPFDLVFMDCQMPDVDGYEATRRIREAERLVGARVPIVALTANAMEGDRQRCLAAGMDDYLAKPFRRCDLIAVLERWGITRSAVNPIRTTSTDHNPGHRIDSQAPSRAL